MSTNIEGLIQYLVRHILCKCAAYSPIDSEEFEKSVSPSGKTWPHADQRKNLYDIHELIATHMKMNAAPHHQQANRGIVWLTLKPQAA